MESVPLVLRLKEICIEVNKNPKDSYRNLKELEDLIGEVPNYLVQAVEPMVMACLFPFIRPPAMGKNDLNLPEEHKKAVIDVLSALFAKIKIVKVELFFNMYCFLLFNIYCNEEKSLVKPIHEEYKLSVVKCSINLFKALSTDILMKVYKKENAPRLCQILYICLEMAENEKLQALRIASMECIQAICKSETDEYMDDAELRKNIADTIMFAFPGLATKLTRIAIEDSVKTGHKIRQTAVKTWGDIVTLEMEDYSAKDQKKSCYKHLQDVLEEKLGQKGGDTKISTEKTSKKFENREQIKDYIENTSRTELWYKETDEKLSHLLGMFTKLTTHQNESVRSTLSRVCTMIFEKCHQNLEISINPLVEILIISSCDESDTIRINASNFLKKIDGYYQQYEFCLIMDHIKKNFCNCILVLPRVFNGLDEKEQLLCLNKILGYTNLFKIFNVELLDSGFLASDVLPVLVEICPLEKPDFKVLEEVQQKEFDEQYEQRTPWLSLNFQDAAIQKSYIAIIKSLSDDELLFTTTEYLMDVFVNNAENRLKVTFLLNQVLESIELSDKNKKIVDKILKLYLSAEYSDLALKVGEDVYGDFYSLNEVRNNILQICFQTEGIGKVSLRIGQDFSHKYLLQTLFEILQRAGSTNPLIRLAGLQAINRISSACGHKNVTGLISSYPDFFSYHVVRRIDKLDCNESVLNVVSAVIKLSTIDVLPSISEIVDSIIMQSCDKFKEHLATSYLQVFKTFVQCLHGWIGTKWKKNEREPIKSRKEMHEEIEHFRISGIDDKVDYSDEAVMGKKTAEEMFREDIEKMQQNEGQDSDDDLDENFVEEVKKPEPTLEIRIAVNILKRSLNFLPSKDKERKLLVLEILINGLEVIKDWEDELLPIVHLIWSPLVGRFQEVNEPVVINYSFQLLVTLARLSKDFIRSRTAKDVLPSLIKVLVDSQKESYLKDKGSAYRYTQMYKLQISILENLSRVIVYLDFSDQHIFACVDAVVPYLSDKQPAPLQKLSLQFIKDLLSYDYDLIKKKFLEIENEELSNTEFVKNISILKNECIKQ